MEERLRHCRSDRDLHACGVYEGESYRSQWYQGLGPGMEWLRLSLETEGEVRVSVYAAEEPADGLAPVLEARASDLLLYGVRGRYLRFAVSPACALKSFELLFPARSIDELLPGVLQGEDGLRRLLGVYQSAYMDLNRELAAFPDRLDVMGERPLPALRRWLGASRWMRRGAPPALLREAPALHRLRGTPAGLARLAVLLTGREGCLVERARWEHAAAARDRAEYTRLFGEGEAALLLPPDTPPAALRVLEAVLPDFVPLGVRCTLRVLKEDAPMDGLCCLDENAALAGLPPALLDEAAFDDVWLEG